jgi:hypothetical protein
VGDEREEHPSGRVEKTWGTRWEVTKLTIVMGANDLLDPHLRFGSDGMKMKVAPS